MFRLLLSGTSRYSLVQICLACLLFILLFTSLFASVSMSLVMNKFVLLLHLLVKYFYELHFIMLHQN